MIKIFAKRMHIFCEVFSLDQNSRQFKKYLRQSFRIKKSKSDSVIMVEFEQSPENVIGLSMFLPILLEKFDSNLVAYQLTTHKGLRKLIKKVPESERERVLENLNFYLDKLDVITKN
jgi:hypothetical protein